MIRPDDFGLYCEPGGFHVDPWRPARLAVITHAHADHARPGCERYLAAEASVPLLRHRLGPGADVAGLPYGERTRLGGVTVSLHPAGHVLGSAQVRIEAGGETWVVTGDYKRDPDPSCAPFEPVRCDVLVTEATFALPVFRWPEPGRVAEEIRAWWLANRAADRPSVLFCYALGKAQRVLAELADLTRDTVHLHGAVDAITALYRESGVAMLPTERVDLRRPKADWRGQLVVAPPSAAGSRWMRRFPGAATGFCSGWMRLRGQRRRRGYDRGFVLSDHADWPGLLATIADSGARTVLTTHGSDAALLRYLRERGLDARPLATAWTSEEGAREPDEPA